MHTVRASLSKVRDELAEDLKAVYRADTVEQAYDALKVLEERWAGRYPDLVAKWLRKSYALLEFVSHPKAIRPYLYTTNQLEDDGGAEEADEGGGGVLWARGPGEARILGVGGAE